MKYTHYFSENKSAKKQTFIEKFFLFLFLFVLPACGSAFYLVVLVPLLLLEQTIQKCKDATHIYIY